MPLASSPERLAAPVLSGLIAAMVCLLSALGLAVIPAIAAQAGSGGGMGLLDAILLGLSALVLAHGGSLVLPAGTITGSITLLPLGLTALLATREATAPHGSDSARLAPPGPAPAGAPSA